MTSATEQEKQLHRLVSRAVEGIDGPDRVRLARIEHRLLATRRSRRAPAWRWLLVGAGLATGAAAAYWGVYGASSIDEPDEPLQAIEASPADGAAAGNGREGTDADGTQGGAAGREDADDPVIYFGQ